MLGEKCQARKVAGPMEQQLATRSENRTRKISPVCCGSCPRAVPQMKEQHGKCSGKQRREPIDSTETPYLSHVVNAAHHLMDRSGNRTISSTQHRCIKHKYGPKCSTTHQKNAYKALQTQLTMPLSSTLSSPDRYGDRKAQQQKKKRVGKACDSCRLKKTKCSGKQPCEKCQADNKICIYTERKKSRDKSYSYDYVELIEKRLRIVNKALINLSEMVKLNKTGELQQFAQSITYNEDDEGVPISINQAISLLVDKSDVVDHSDSETNPEHWQGHISKTESQDSALEESSGSAVPQPAVKKEELSAGFIPYSSPDSLTPRSDDPFSPLPQNDFSAEFMFEQQTNSTRLDDIKEEKNDDFLNQMSPMPTSLMMDAVQPPPVENESYDNYTSMTPAQFDVSGFKSGAGLAAAAVNGLLGRSQASGSGSGFMMSDFDLNSPPSILATSPDSVYNSKTVIPASMNLSRNDSSYSSYFGEDSYIDSAHPPSNLQRSASTRSTDSGNRKHGTLRGNHHSYSQHPHPYKKTSHSVGSALVSPLLKDELLSIN
ncbi:hypothetical protein KL911_002501 [Ogataea haglerorum]|uniref:uncharacterized protein n=1 Tax=Ogataea haglerorum TaxID=1937702 RepID=UPI001C896ACB|nr:uncharacterized protein KL911_002501 [Ogataea haglerorum]KAG7696592.1 hypothetical protein KL951_003048 [Ogataea haglerorum]KAG7748076.1 hypothetical protein KL912_002753 [Ogataea haglerorum]KAG7754025.1 hypothetical protein KL911_002501 [Ogataea haglerorum]